MFNSMPSTVFDILNIMLRSYRASDPVTSEEAKKSGHVQKVDNSGRL